MDGGVLRMRYVQNFVRMTLEEWTDELMEDSTKMVIR